MENFEAMETEVLNQIQKSQNDTSTGLIVDSVGPVSSCEDMDVGEDNGLVSIVKMLSGVKYFVGAFSCLKRSR